MGWGLWARSRALLRSVLDGDLKPGCSDKFKTPPFVPLRLEPWQPSLPPRSVSMTKQETPCIVRRCADNEGHARGDGLVGAVDLAPQKKVLETPRDRLAIGFNPEAMRDVAGRPSPRGSRRRVLFGSACCAVRGAMFGNQFQGRIFVGTTANALPISVDDPLMTNVLDCIFCHCGSRETPSPDWH